MADTSKTVSRHKPYRPPAGLVMRSWVHLPAFGGGVGLSPWAPGTFGTVVGVILWWILSWLPIIPYAVIAALLFLLGCYLCGASAREMGVHDHGGIVFDEIVGFLIAGFPLLPALHWWVGPLWAWLLAAFVLFRLFDIFKPPPIRWFDRNVKGGFGIMLDDVLAAIPVAILLLAAERIIPLFQ